MAKIQSNVVSVAVLHKPYVRMLESAHAKVYTPMSISGLTEFIGKMRGKERQNFQEAVLGAS